MDTLDETDFEILAHLKENARLTTKELSKLLGLPQTTVHNRIKRLREKGVIKRFTVEFDRKKVGKGLVAYIMCTVSYSSARGHKINQYDVAQTINRLPEVEEVSIVTGEIDLIVKVALQDVDALNEFLISKLRNIDGVEKTTTSVVLSQV